VVVATRTQAEEARRMLGECVLFRDLDPRERNILFARVCLRSYAAGETIFLMGSAALVIIPQSSCHAFTR
jgi:hypothetical protein